MIYYNNIPACDSFSSLYKNITDTILRTGKKVLPRGKETKELRPVMLGIDNPLKRVVTLPGRDMNVFFLIVEAIWILAGKKDAKTLSIFNSNIAQFSDDGINFNAPYGFRLKHYNTNSFIPEEDVIEEDEINQLFRIVKILEKDEDSRQAVASIWNPNFDLMWETESKDLPCNDMLMFKIREGKLNLTVINRSNDLHWGLPTNIFQFSMILDVMSYILRKNVGQQTHMIDSLHYYVDNPITNNILLRNEHFDIYDFYSPMKFSTNQLGDDCDMISMRFHDTFHCISLAWQYIESFENRWERFLQEDLISFEDGKTFENKMLKNFSPYLYSMARLALVYFLYKRNFEYIARNDIEMKIKFERFFLINNFCISILNHDVIQKDMLVSGMSFLYKRTVKRFNKFKMEKESCKFINNFFQIIENKFIAVKTISDFVMKG